MNNLIRVLKGENTVNNLYYITYLKLQVENGRDLNELLGSYGVSWDELPPHIKEELK